MAEGEDDDVRAMDDVHLRRRKRAPAARVPPDGELHELSASIGELRARVETLAETVRDNQVASTREHRIVHDIVVATSEAVRNLTSKVAEMKPLTDDYREKRAEARGAAHLARWLYATGGGIVAAAAVKIMDIFAGRPPHP